MNLDILMIFMVLFPIQAWCRMSIKCSIPLCRGNYGTGDELCVFSFPKDSDMADQWLRVIRCDVLVLTKNTKVYKFVVMVL